MSISRKRLYECVRDFLNERYPDKAQLPMLLYMLRITIFNRPEKNCIRKVPRSRWKGLPKNKSLFGTNGERGLPIGNLTSQLLALLFLDPLDHLVVSVWLILHYGRYVDDMVLVYPSAVYLLQVRDRIIQWLAERELTLHPKKMYLQHYSKGVMFVGGMIKPGRKYMSHRTIGRMFAVIHRYNELLVDPSKVSKSDIESLVASMNSYLGMMKHYNSVRLFHRVLRRVSPDWYRYIYFSKRGRSVKLVIRSRPNAQKEPSLLCTA